MKRVMLEKMLRLAANAHAGQFDLEGQPYFLHCMRVLVYLSSDDEELQCIAVGHDLLEDTKITVEDLEREFTSRVVSGIDRLTKWPGQSYEGYKIAVLSSVDAMLVKKADLTDNSDLRRLKGIRPKDLERTARYYAFFLEIVAELEKRK